MRRVLVTLMFIVGLLGSSDGLSVTADEVDVPVDHQHGGHPEGTPAPGSPHVGRSDHRAGIRSLTPEEITQIAQGEGAGFALPAELNGVPGPRHVLDLRHDLGLSPAQLTHVQAIYDQMQAAVIPIGQRYLDALQRLEAELRAGTVTETELLAQVTAVKQIEAELAAAHLVAHLKTAEVLTPEQIAAYTRLRGYE